MSQATFDAAKPQIDALAEEFERILRSPDLVDAGSWLETLAEALRDGDRVSVQFVLELHDQAGRRLRLACRGVSVTTREGVTWDSSETRIERYAVAGRIEVVPDNRCPACWGEWRCKSRQRMCPACGLTLDNDATPAGDH